MKFLMTGLSPTSSFTSAFVLLIACVNFMNLATARSVRRAKEVGLRKVVGANRRQLIRQFFAESVLMSLLALFFALLLVECLLPLFNHVSGKQLSSSRPKNPSFLLIFIGLASFITEQRTREIGIRKVLGSSTAGIVGLLNRDFLKWILTAAFIAWPAAYLTMHFWLQKFAYRIPIEIWIFFLSAAIGLGVGLITVSLQTLKAARTRPANSLKHE